MHFLLPFSLPLHCFLSFFVHVFAFPADFFLHCFLSHFFRHCCFFFFPFFFWHFRLHFVHCLVSLAVGEGVSLTAADEGAEDEAAGAGVFGTGGGGSYKSADVGAAV